MATVIAAEHPASPRRYRLDRRARRSLLHDACGHAAQGERATRPSFSIALRSFSLMTFISAGVVVPPYRTQVRPRRSLGSFAPCAWMMKVRRIPRTPPKRPASKTTLSRGEACPELVGDAGGPAAVQSS